MSFTSDQKNQTIKIYIKTITGKAIALDAETSDTVENIKQKIMDTEGIPPAQQRLMYNGYFIEDGNTLASYGIKNKSILTSEPKEDITLHLILPMR